jgi:MFS family permease
MLYFVSYFHRVSITVIVEDLMRDFSASATSLGFLSSLYFYPYAAMQIPAGLLVDSIGSRKTLTLFCFMASIGTLIFAFSPNLFSAMLGRALVGLGVSVAFLCTAKLIASWFDAKSFASLTGLLVSIGNIGALIGSAPLAYLVTALGWRFSFFLIASATFVLTIALWFEVKDAPKEITPRPCHSHSTPAPPNNRWDRSTDGIRLSFRSRDFWFTAFPPLFFFGTFISLQGLWGVPYLMQVYELSKIDASIVIMMMAIGFSFGATFWGLVSDRLVVSRKRVYLIGLVLYSLTWFLFTSVTTETTRSFLPLLLLLLGFFFGVMPISIVMVKELFPKRMMGAATGSANAYPFVGAAFYQILIGYFLDTHGLVNIVEGVRVFSRVSYRLSFTVCLATLIAATAMAFLIKEHLESREE